MQRALWEGAAKEADGSAWGAVRSLGGLLGGGGWGSSGLGTAFQELTEDASKSVVEISSAVQAWGAGWASTPCLPRRGKCGREKFIYPAWQAAGLHAIQAESSRHDGRAYSEDACEPEEEEEDDGLIERVWKPLTELADDVGGPSVLVPGALTIIVGPSLTPTYSALSVVTMSSWGIPLRGLLAMLLICSSVGMVTQLNRYPEDAQRSLQRSGGVVFGLCLAYQLSVMAVAGGFPMLPMHITAPFPHPEIVAHCLLDLLCGPPVILNLGYLVGRPPQQMLPTIGVAALGHVSFAVAAVVPSTLRSLAIFGLGFCFMVECASDLTHGLPAKALELLGTDRERGEQRRRAQMSADLVVFSWASLAGVELLGLLHLLPPGVIVQCFLTCDILGKMGTCHLVSKTRETVAFANRQLAPLEDGESR